MPLRPGDRFGRYALSGPLGKGGMGEVYSAYDTLLHRNVALKMLVGLAEEKGPASSDEGRQRLLREARAAARVTHPNAVAIYDVGEEDGVAFLAMELVAGRSLRSIASGPRVRLQQRVRWLCQIARALGAAHQLGIVHRDVKPENVMIATADGRAKVLDFGIARRSSVGEEDGAPPHALATLTATGIISGTPMYMGPEQMRGDPLDGRSDQFSWGVMAYELLAGKRPWNGAGFALAAQILSSEPKALHEVAVDVSAEVDAVVRKAMSKSREGRFATMEEAAEALEAAASSSEMPSELAAAEPQRDTRENALAFAPTERLAAKRGSRWGVVAGVAALAAIGGVGVKFFLGRSHAQPVAPIVAPVAEVQSEMSSNREATAAYRAGMQAERGAAIGAAQKELSRAIELDPLFAAAHLQHAILSAMFDGGLTSEFKDDLQQARNSRTSLGDHDRVLLDAFEPWARVPPDLEESQRRLESATEHYPAAPEFEFALGLVLDFAERPALAQAAFERVLKEDPSFALAWRLIGFERLALDDRVGALEAYGVCLKLSPGGTSCLADLAALQANEGKCVELEATSRRLIALAPDSPAAYFRLAEALSGTGQSSDAVRVALQQQWDRQPPEQRRRSEHENEASLSILHGDFAEAQRRLAELQTATAADPNDTTHTRVAYGAMLFNLEIGRPSETVRLAESYLRRRSAWTPNNFDGSIYISALELEAGGITPGQFAGIRAAWLARNADADPGSQWIFAYALPVHAKEDAAAALLALPNRRPLVTAGSMTPQLAEPIARTYLLTGHIEEAIDLLSRAASSCAAFDGPAEVIFSTWAALDLGEALEAKGGGSESACACYRTVLTRWGSANAPSRTAARARLRSRALACPP